MSGFADTSVDVVVRSVRAVARGVISVELAAYDGSDLPEWAPGAHIDLVLPSGQVRQYSLCGAVADRKAYEIAILREAAGKGGSREIHDTPLLGRRLAIRGPRNHFVMEEAPAYRFIAGGIGVTPILPMIARAEALGRDWRLLYGARSRDFMAFRDRFAAFFDKVILSCDDEAGPLNLDDFLRDIPAEAAVFCCGPEGLLQAVEQRFSVLDRGRLYMERFSAPATPDLAPEEQHSFEVVLERSGLVVEVGPGQSILEAVRQAGVDTPYSCANGVCGACETVVVAGRPMHRDCILSPKERAEGKTMMICVGRALTDRLVLDL